MLFEKLPRQGSDGVRDSFLGQIKERFDASPAISKEVKGFSKQHPILEQFGVASDPP